MTVLEMLKKCKRWVVIGDVENQQKYANKIYNKLKEFEYEVFGVFKRPSENTFENLESIKGEYYIDLCINPVDGIKYIKEAKRQGVKNIVIQPGAESAEIIDFCKENDMHCVKGCVLKELNNMH